MPRFIKRVRRRSKSKRRSTRSYKRTYKRFGRLARKSRALSRGRRVPTRTGFNAPVPKIHWKKRRTSRTNTGQKQLTSTLSRAAIKKLSQQLNVVPDSPDTSLNPFATNSKNLLACNASLGQRDAYKSSWSTASGSVPDCWRQENPDGSESFTPFSDQAGHYNPAGDPPPFALTALGGKVGMFIYRFNPRDMENWSEILADYNWIRILGMEFIIKPHWTSRFKNSGSCIRAPDVQTRFSVLRQTQGVVNDGTDPGEVDTSMGFNINQNPTVQPLNAELFVHKFDTQTAATGVAPGGATDFEAYSSTTKMLDNGIIPINMESGRTVRIKVKPTAYMRTFAGSNMVTPSGSAMDYTKIPSQWTTTLQMDKTFQSAEFEEPHAPALATLGLCLKNVPVQMVQSNIDGAFLGNRYALKLYGEIGGELKEITDTTDPDYPGYQVNEDFSMQTGTPIEGDTNLDDITAVKQLSQCSVQVVYHYLVKGSKRPKLF